MLPNILFLLLMTSSFKLKLKNNLPLMKWEVFENVNVFCSANIEVALAFIINFFYYHWLILAAGKKA